MNVSEECDMLELCELETDDLKSSGEFSKAVKKEVENPEEKKHTVSISDDTKALYVRLKIDVTDPRIRTFFRLDTIFMQGVDDMNTSEVYKFFEPLKPLSLEWINDSCCNAVWADDDTAAQAILNVSLLEPAKSDEKELSEDSTVLNKDKVMADPDKVIVMEEEDDDEKSEDGELSEDDANPQLVWRKTTNKQIKIRFANWGAVVRFSIDDDKKVRGAEKYSEYYKKYGNPNFGGLRGLISGTRKRKLRGLPEYTDLDLPPVSERDIQSIPRYHDLDQPSSNEESEPTLPLGDARLRISQIAAEKSESRDTIPKRPKMKMYADEEEKKTHTPKASRVTSRLGNILVNFSRDSESDHELDDLELSSPREFGSKSVWDRLQVEVPNSRSEDRRKDHRSESHMSSRSSSSSNSSGRQRDLRKKLQRIRDDRRNDHRSPLLVKASPD